MVLFFVLHSSYFLLWFCAFLLLLLTLSLMVAFVFLGFVFTRNWLITQ